MSMTYWVIIVAAIALSIVLYRTMAWPKKFIAYVARDEMPIWLSISLAISAAIGTYFLAPIINEDFEFQKNRSAHVMQTVNTVNGDFVELTKLVRQFNDDLFYQDKKNLRESRGKLLDKIAELQWKLIDMRVIIRRSGQDDNCVDQLATSLEGLRASAMEAKQSEDQEKVIEAYLAAGKAGENCLAVLYSSAKIS